MKGLVFPPFFPRAHVENKKNSLHLPNRGDLSKESLFKKNSDKGNPFYLRKEFVTLEMCLVPQTIAVFLGVGGVNL